MSAGPDPRVDSQLIEQERRKLTRRLDEMEKMCESTAPPSLFYGEMLKRILESLAAPAGVIWTRTPQGNLQMQFQINAGEVGLERTPDGRAIHDEFLRYVVTQNPPRQIHLPPHSGIGAQEPGKATAGNPTDYLLLVVPIVQNDQLTGLIEIWQAPNRPPATIPGFLQYMTLMANLASRYQRHQMLGQMVGQQQLWTQLEAFARRIHSTLNPIEVAYHVANEGARLIECDRLDVAVRYGQRVKIESVSGCDVVEHRSNEVVCLRRLAHAVLDWGEKLVFQGTRDESLPPKVGLALDDYLLERPSKLLVVLPLRDERDGEVKDKDHKQPRAAIVMEAFEPPEEQKAQLMARLDVVGAHATSALYNAVEHRRIPMRFLWMPLAALQEGLGGKTRMWITLGVAVASLLVGALFLLPYPLKMDSTGQLLPEVRAVVYSPTNGTVKKFEVNVDDPVSEHRVLGQMYDVTLETKIRNLLAERDAAASEAGSLTRLADTREGSPAEQADLRNKALQQDRQRAAKQSELEALLKRTNSVPNQPGHFALRAPEFTSNDGNKIRTSLIDTLERKRKSGTVGEFTPEEIQKIGTRQWTVLTGNFKDEWLGREARPTEPILRLGAKDGPWELEMKIPQKHIGQVLRAFERLDAKVLDVDYLLRSDPTRVFKGKLYRNRVSGEATPNKDDNNESEPVVICYVNIVDPAIPEDYRLPEELQLAGAEVHAKVRCGKARMGYALFYGVWEFLYEKVVFYLF